MSDIISIIVAKNTNDGEHFLYIKKLNKECFKIATKIRDLEGICKNTPIIIMPDTPNDLVRMAMYRFDSVRYIWDLEGK